ncbi:hypothetical protein [Stenotrophomonas tumulicola]|uniref:Uncharacterized protein n=1 Tax=Stenotrophomonas tumulicola TaxID=1685415 RepID=A0A7W3IHE4_9GAMM|nr:hypothetical protein [Stenotrophomonas tumulicola]MBA8680509.1 hypothetical protein [Stenotrophomonas tumulicola]
MAKTVSLLLLTLVIDRDATTKLPVQAFDFERPILNELYPEESISEVKRESIEVKNFDVAEAFAGLENKYGRTAEGAEALRYAYRSRAEFAKAVETSIAGAKEDSGLVEDEEEGDQPAELEDLASKTIAEIEAELDNLTDEELHELAEIEKASKNRKGVLDAISAALGEQGSDTE